MLPISTSTNFQLQNIVNLCGFLKTGLINSHTFTYSFAARATEGFFCVWKGVDRGYLVAVTGSILLLIEYRSDDVTKNFFLHFSILDTMSRWSMMKNIHSPNLVGIGSWGPEIWPHEHLLSPIEISVNWPGSNSYEPGQIYTDFNGAN